MIAWQSSPSPLALRDLGCLHCITICNSITLLNYWLTVTRSQQSQYLYFCKISIENYLSSLSSGQLQYLKISSSQNMFCEKESDITANVAKIQPNLYSPHCNNWFKNVYNFHKSSRLVNTGGCEWWRWQVYWDEGVDSAHWLLAISWTIRHTPQLFLLFFCSSQFPN